MPLQSSIRLNSHEGGREISLQAFHVHLRHRDAQGCSDIPPEHRQNKLSRRAAPPPQFSARVCSTIARLAMAAAGVAARLEALATVAQVAGAELAAQTAAQLHAQEVGLVGDLLRRQGPEEGGCGKQGGRRGVFFVQTRRHETCNVNPKRSKVGRDRSARAENRRGDLSTACRRHLLRRGQQAGAGDP